MRTFTRSYLPYYNCTVTPEGKAAMLAESPKPPKLSRSQRRYREFLNADTGESFGEWIARHSPRKIAIALFLSVFALRADTIFVSGDGIGESNDRTGVNQIIAPHPAWVPAFAGSQWISFGPTGYGDLPFIDNTTVGGIPTASFVENFTVASAGVLTLQEACDDACGIWLDSTLVAPAGSFNFNPGVTLLVSLPVSAGAHVLRSDLFQLGGDVTGLDYSGTFIAAPEPRGSAFLLILLLCLAGVFRCARRVS